MFSKFFIDRPVFAAVISIVIVLAGFVAMRALPIAQYPAIVPPEVTVTATYPGASAQTIAETVAARWSSRSTASRTCSTCARPRPAPAR